MIPTLHDEFEVRFSSLGIGGLGEATSCRVEWQENGMYELTMIYPVSGFRYADLKPRRIILSSVGPDEDPQPFRIYRVKPGLLSSVTVYARHVAYDLMGYTVLPFQASGLEAACTALTSDAVTEPHGFVITAEKSSTATCAVKTPRNIWSMLGGREGSLLDIYKGVWDFSRFRLTLRERLGADNGVLVRYGKNLQSLEQDENLANTWTAVQPYWLSQDETVLVTLPEVTISTGTFDYVKILELDLSGEWQDPPTVEQLRARASRYISDNRVGVPAVALDVKFLPLDQTEEYKQLQYLAAVHKGDTVTVEFPTAVDRATGAPRAFVRATAQVVEYVWLPMEDRYESVRLGRRKSNFVKVLAQTQKDVQFAMTKLRR